MGPVRTGGSLESLRERNRLRVVDALRASGAVSRADIARSTGLCRSTVSSLVADLQADGLVRRAREPRHRPRRPGRPPAGAAHARRRRRRRSSASTSATRTCASPSPTSSSTSSPSSTSTLDVDHARPRGARHRRAPGPRDARRRPASTPGAVLAAGVGLPGPDRPRDGPRRARRRSCPAGSGIDPAAELERRLDVPVHARQRREPRRARPRPTFGAGRGAGDSST